jgi:outer membrane lipoprotein-sorting protein
MKKIISLVCMLPLLVFSQDDKAKSILDQLSAKTTSYTSIEAHFINTFVSVEAGVNEEQEGILYIKDNSYRLELKAQTINLSLSKKKLKNIISNYILKQKVCFPNWKWL